VVGSACGSDNDGGYNGNEKWWYLMQSTEYNTYPHSWYDLLVDQCMMFLYDFDVWSN
jgi:hypothetical protein